MNGMVNPAAPDDLPDDRPVEPLDRVAGQKSDSAYRTISEVAVDLNLPQHVLRFWESKFKQISPLKRGGGRRYYRPQDVDLIKRIHHLLHTQGYTIKGVQKLLVKDRNLSTSTSLRDVAKDDDNDRHKAAFEVLTRMNEEFAAPMMDDHASSINRTDLQIILNRLKALRTQISKRC